MSNECELLRQELNESLDRESPLTSRLERHAAECAECGALVRATAAVREHLRTVPLPPPDGRSDRMLLAGLRAEGVTSVPWDGAGRPRPWWLGAPARLVLTGATAFVVTLAAATLLSQPGSSTNSEREVAAPARGSVVRRPASPSSAEEDLERWLRDPMLRALPGGPRPRGGTLPRTPTPNA